MRLLLKVAIALAAGSLLQSIPPAAQVSPTTEKATWVRITKGPEIERADPEFAIIKWTSNNPGGSPEHYGVVHYGTDPKGVTGRKTVVKPLRGGTPSFSPIPIPAVKTSASGNFPLREASLISANFCPSVPMDSTAPTPYSW